jgi:hypothetical protein
LLAQQPQIIEQGGIRGRRCDHLLHRRTRYPNRPVVDRPQLSYWLAIDRDLHRLAALRAP